MRRSSVQFRRVAPQIRLEPCQREVKLDLSPNRQQVGAFVCLLGSVPCVPCVMLRDAEAHVRAAQVCFGVPQHEHALALRSPEIA